MVKICSSRKEFARELLTICSKNMLPLRQNNLEPFADGSHGGFAATAAWCALQSREIFAAYTALSDPISKDIYIHLIAYRLMGYRHIIIPASFRSRAREIEEFRALERQHSSPSTLEIATTIGVGLRHFDYEYKGHRYVIDCFGLEYYLARKQYFLNRGSISVAPRRGDIVIDGGACTGDSGSVFSNAVGPGGHVHCFDPVAEHIKIIRHNADKGFVYKNVSAWPFALGARDLLVDPISIDRCDPGFRPKPDDLPVRSIDSMHLAGDIGRVDFIKLDIEGGEKLALIGGNYVINKYRPRLAVSLYHNRNDIFELILLIREMFPFYELYLDHYTYNLGETVLYCRDQLG